MVADSADADLLLAGGISNWNPEMDKLANADSMAEHGTLDINLSETVTDPLQFRGFITVGNRKRKRSKLKDPTLKLASRSSTMPGLLVESNQQRAFRENIRLVEERTGRRFTDTPEARSKRRKANGETMYKNSASVPESLIRFAGEIHNESRITRKEEIELGEKTQEAIRLQNLYDVLKTKLQREPTDAEWCAAAGKINMEAIRQEIEEGLQAKNKLVTSNLRMVQSVVNTYIRNGLSSQYNAADMMQDGILALIRAAEMFEPQRGWKFSTYAMYWVRASVKRSQLSQSRIIAVPQRLFETHKRLEKVELELSQILGRKPTRKELGDVVGMSELQIKRCYAAVSQRCFSIDQQIRNTHKPMKADSQKDSIVDILESKSDEDTPARRIGMRDNLIEILNRYLRPEEVEVLLLRYGLKETPNNHLSGRRLTIAELSHTLEIKPDRARRIINNSLKRLKSAGMEELLAYEREFF